MKKTANFATTALAGIHQMLAFRLDIPGLALKQDEAEALGKAIADVQAFYPLAILDPVYLAWMNLAVTLAKVEAPRAMLIMAKTNAEKKGPKSNGVPAS